MNNPKKKRKRYGRYFQVYFQEGKREELEESIGTPITSQMVVYALEKLSTGK